MTRVLSVDLETFSPIDLKKAGVYSYTEHPDFEILLFGYAWDDDPVCVVDLKQNESIPQEVTDAIVNGTARINAFNASFERVCLSRHFKVPGFLNPENFICTMVHSLYLGLPASLDKVATVLQVGGKLTEGKDLIKYFCVPCKPTATNGGRTRNLPYHDPEKWERFKQYNLRDVEVERQVRTMLSRFPVPENEWRLWALDQQINDRGILVDSSLVDHAIHCDEQHKSEAIEEAIRLTGLDNPGSVYQLKNWLYEKEGLETEKLTKDTVPELVKKTGSTTVKRVLELRQELAKTSVRKYTAVKNAFCKDNRVRGLLQFYGARTGRWSGKIFQPQNLPRISLSHLDLTTARNLLKSSQYEMLDVLYKSTPDVLSQLVRTILIANKGYIFHVVDFNSIEALLLAYYAGENWALDVFYAGGDIYAHTASRMYGMPVSAITKESAERARGKLGCLASGYQGSIGAIQKFIKPGEMTEDEMKEIVYGWREANPNIVKFWRQFEEAAREAIATKTFVSVTKGIGFIVQSGMLFMQLPSGRRLSYPKVRIESHPVHGRDAICFEGINSVTKKWDKQFTYSGKLVENCLAANTLVLTQRGWVSIVEVQLHDLLWDGIEWVTHDGVKSCGIQNTLEVDGVRVTPEHRILTERGWINASSCEGYKRAEVILPDCFRLCRKRRQELIMESPMRLQQDNYNGCIRIHERNDEELRLQEIRINSKVAQNTWNVEASGLCSMAFNDQQMHAPNPSSLDELRRVRDQSVRKMAKQFSGFLARHGANLSIWSIAGPKRCKWRLRTGKLPLDNGQKAMPKQTQQRFRTYPVGLDDNSRGSGPHENWGYNTLVPLEEQLPPKPFVLKAGRAESVYDILNAGNRMRFVVKGNNGPFVVHNCIQAIARDCLAEAMHRAEATGYPILLTVHDELITHTAQSFGSAKELAEIVTQPISWAPGLKLRASGESTKYYCK